MRIYVHGLGQGPGSWGRTIELTGDTRGCVCPELATMCRGGEAAYSGLYEAFCDECGRWDEPLDLCGLSLGGVLALNYAIEHRERVRSLVLIAAQYKMPRTALKLQNAIFRLMPQRAFRQTGFSKSEVIRLCGSMAELDFSGQLDRIVCPTLIVCGERDTANRRASEELAGAIKGARLVIAGSAGHEINTEAPEKLAEILRDFYADAR